MKSNSGTNQKISGRLNALSLFESFHKKSIPVFGQNALVAEEEGFEPPEPVKVLRFSRPVQ